MRAQIRPAAKREATQEVLVSDSILKELREKLKEMYPRLAPPRKPIVTAEGRQKR